MDIFRFTNPNDPTKMEQAEIINGLTSKMWVERYREAGEFTFVGPTSSGIKEKLPIGSFVSHVDATEIMIVENHEINEDRGSESLVTVTGRGFETYLDNRIVNSNRTFPVSETPTDYAISGGYTWDQVVSLIQHHIDPFYLLDDNDGLPFVSVMSIVSGISVSIARTAPRGSLYEAVLNLLAVDDLGIKVVRPGPWSPLLAGSPNTALVIHVGENKTSSVIFSYDSGEIESADYLWSNQRFKNAALVTGKWVEITVVPSAVGYDRRWMFIDASDIDQNFSAPPTDAFLTNVIDLMQRRGTEILLSQKDIALTKADISKEAVNVKYRVDFNVGDFITVAGDYNEISAMRVTEFVEIEDETGSYGYPTLSMP